MMAEKPELLLCPFCGGVGAVVNGEHSGCEEHLVVECSGCNACGPDAGYPDTDIGSYSEEWNTARAEAIRLWNRRVK